MNMDESKRSTGKAGLEYLNVARQAAELERAGMFGDAAEKWRFAGQLALSSLDRHWCEVRQMLCKGASWTR